MASALAAASTMPLQGDPDEDGHLQRRGWICLLGRTPAVGDLNSLACCVVGHPYPEYWEADVVLRDGGTAHVRPIGPDDADRLLAFYHRLSDQSKYFRFFAPHPTLSEREVRWLTHPNYRDEVGLLAQVGTEMIGLVGY